MKNVLKIIGLVTIITLFGCSSSKLDSKRNNNRSFEISYIATNVQDVQGRKVLLTDGTAVELENIPFIDSGTRVFVVINKEMPGGYIYSGDRKYKLVSSSYRAFDKGYDLFYHDGILTKIRKVNVQPGVLILANKERFKIRKNDFPLLRLFAEGDEIIIDESEDYLINLRIGSEIRCSKITKNRRKHFSGKRKRRL